jgi:hypothetical protein
LASITNAKCLVCGYTYSEADVKKEVEKTVREVMEEEKRREGPKEYQEGQNKDFKLLQAGRSKRLRDAEG